MIRFIAIDLWDCSLDPAERLFCGSRQDGAAFSCSLSRPEYRVLQRLLMEPGVAVDRDELTRHAWENRPVTAGSLNNAIFNLRQAFGGDEGRRVIRTVPNKGYRIRATVLDGLATPGAQPPSEDQGKPDEADDERASPEAASGLTRRRGGMAALAVLLVANLAGVFWYAHSTPRPIAVQGLDRPVYEYQADIGGRRFFSQLSAPIPSERLARALKAFTEYPPPGAADKPNVYINHGDASDEFSFFLCQEPLDASPADCSAYVIQRDPHS